VLRARVPAFAVRVLVTDLAAACPPCPCRLHRHVYDRLAAAQRCARDKNQPQFRQTGDEHRKEPDPQVSREWVFLYCIAVCLTAGWPSIKGCQRL
jgi:hypothetical protein